MYENPERKALIKLGYACNNRCVFCHSAPLRGEVAAAAPAAILAKIAVARLQGYEMVVFSGGEPTVYPHLAKVLRGVRREGLSLGFVTNGRRFAYPSFLEGLLGFRLGYIYMSLHGAHAETHNRLVGARAWDETLSAIRHLSAVPNLQLTVNTVVTSWNVDELEAIVDLLVEMGGMRVKLSYLEPKGDALEWLDELLLPPEQAAKRIRQAIDYGRARASQNGVALAWDALPLCLMDGYEDLYDDLLTNRIEVMSEADESAFFPVDHLNKRQAPVCAACAVRDRCPGLYHGVLDRYGEGMLTPFVNIPAKGASKPS